MPSYHMRRKDKQVTEHNELVKPLKEAEYITLALCSENKPYIATISHGYDEENNCIYFHSAKEGKKIDIIKENPLVWGQALIDAGYQHGSCDHLYHTTQFSGTVTFVEDMTEKEHALKLTIKQLDNDPETIIENQVKPNSVAKVYIGRIDIQEMTGKKADKIIISL
ncbi:MAG: pyridoxamine 5'-phosphate oxidase family protein [Candidatus Bathyarchaeota archaeon]|nr:pyridoxamine 5'-phosphate oxidase family protein [Candidatus Bathyarchaeota archaeon]